MGRFFKSCMILSMVFVMLLIVGLEIASAQKYFDFSGRVVTIYRGTLSVKNDKGETMTFAVGRRTTYDPPRLPAVGERVEVKYFLRRGHNVGYQVKILPPPPPPPPPAKKK
jgi:hypothetical protein